MQDAVRGDGRLDVGRGGDQLGAQGSYQLLLWIQAREHFANDGAGTAKHVRVAIVGLLAVVKPNNTLSSYKPLVAMDTQKFK